MFDNIIDTIRLIPSEYIYFVIIAALLVASWVFKKFIKFATSIAVLLVLVFVIIKLAGL